jgi:hypothetical protein
MTDARKLTSEIMGLYNAAVNDMLEYLDAPQQQIIKLFLETPKFAMGRYRRCKELTEKLTGSGPAKRIKPKKGKKQNGTTPLPIVRAGRVRVARIPGAKE